MSLRCWRRCAVRPVAVEWCPFRAGPSTTPHELMPAPSIEQASRDWLTQWWADSNLTPTPTLIATERPARAACRYPLIVVRQLPGGREERCLGHLEPATITDRVAVNVHGGTHDDTSAKTVALTIAENTRDALVAMTGRTVPSTIDGLPDASCVRVEIIDRPRWRPTLDPGHDLAGYEFFARVTLRV